MDSPDVDDLNRRMCDFALARHASMGERDGGLYNYYTVLARGGRMLRPEEIAVAAFIDRVRPSSVLELAAGAAQLGHLLALRGHKAAAVEIDRLRYDFAVALGKHLGSSCAILRGGWQDQKLDGWGMLVTLNAASSHIFPSDTKWLVDYAAAGGEFIIRPRQFGARGIPVEIPGLTHTLVHEDIYHYAR